MSVVSVEPIASRSSSIDQEFARTYTITYRVITDNRLDGPLVARAAVPYVIGQSYVFGTEFDTGAFCLDISSEQEGDDGKFWLVKCQFGRAPALEENPLLQPWEITLSGQAVEVPFDIDADGRPVCNSIGDPFSTALMKQTNQPVLSITRNEASFNPALVLFANTVNSDAFYGGAPGTVLFQPANSQRQYSSTYGYFWTTQYSFAYNPDGWDKQLINQGFRARNPRGVLKNILVQGVPITEPALLTWGGDILPQGAPPVILTFKPYPRMPFAALGL